MGRIDDDDPARQIWVFPYTQASFGFTGTSLDILLTNHWAGGESDVGVMLDGLSYKIRIPANETELSVTLADHLPDIEHEVVVYKRRDGQHYIELHGFGIDDDAQILPPSAPAPTRRIEVFGDSVSAGERNEATRYTGHVDPAADLSGYSDSWCSYAAITARRCNAELHNISQGGAALIDGIGWFNGPDPKGLKGMESIWDRIEYNPNLNCSKRWDFSRFTPHVVIVAIGQNDAHPHDFMKDAYFGREAAQWRNRYAEFIARLRSTYPRALIVCMTTVMNHDAAWDRAIADVSQAARDAKVVHHLFSRNGSATPGHPRIIEHEEMAKELTLFLERLGDDIWQ
jgi:hypothetical protein